MPAGRPSKYDPKYCDEVVAYMGQGYSKTAFAGSIGVCRDTILEWSSTIPEFSGAVKAAEAARVQSLETGLLQSDQLGPQVTARIFALKNAAPDEWRDRREFTGADGGPIAVAVVKFVDDDAD